MVGSVTVDLDKSPEVDKWLSKSGSRINNHLFTYMTCVTGIDNQNQNNNIAHSAETRESGGSDCFGKDHMKSVPLPSNTEKEWHGKHAIKWTRSAYQRWKLFYYVAVKHGA